MRRMRLRKIATVDFRASESSIFDELVKQDKSLTKMSKQDAILLRSKTGQQLAILHSPKNVQGKRDRRKIFHTERFRLNGHATWNGLMIADYGKSLGIHFIGLPTFDEHVKYLLKKVFPGISNKEVKRAMGQLDKRDEKHLKLVA